MRWIITWANYTDSGSHIFIYLWDKYGNNHTPTNTFNTTRFWQINKQQLSQEEQIIKVTKFRSTSLSTISQSHLWRREERRCSDRGRPPTSYRRALVPAAHRRWRWGLRVAVARVVGCRPSSAALALGRTRPLLSVSPKGLHSQHPTVNKIGQSETFPHHCYNIHYYQTPSNIPMYSATREKDIGKSAR